MHMDAEVALLQKLGLDFELLDSGCCGMAGSFGFEKDKYDVSLQIGERVLLPAIRDAAADTLIIADGFSCREQIEQCTGRSTKHVAEVLAMAIDEEQGLTEIDTDKANHPSFLARPAVQAAACAGGLAAGIILGKVIVSRLAKRSTACSD
jgi:hypothetical protein